MQRHREVCLIHFVVVSYTHTHTLTRTELRIIQLECGVNETHERHFIFHNKRCNANGKCS